MTILLHRRKAYRGGGVPTLDNYTTDETSSSRTSMTLTKPSGVSNGDLLLILTGSGASGANGYDTPPTGWTLINYASSSVGSDRSVSAFYRIADGTEGATIGVNQTTSDRCWGVYALVKNAHGSTPIDVTGSDYNNSSESHNTSGVAVTTTVDNCLSMFVTTADNVGSDFWDNFGTWAGTHVDLNTGVSAACVGVFGHNLIETAGGGGHFTNSTSPDTTQVSAFHFAIAPAA